MSEVHEIVDGIYRICSLSPGEYPVGFNQFLIDDERPTLIHTGFFESYDAVREAVAQVLDPARLAHVVLGHFESDECGGMDRFLADARVRHSSRASWVPASTSPTGATAVPFRECTTVPYSSSAGIACGSSRQPRTCITGTR
jgi:glyoxylase-like metal-dependent hydrolase (beta-lactamase superfamily II)